MYGRNRIAGVTVGLAVIALCVFSVSAFASGSFTWTAVFNSTLRSRDYSTPNSGNHTIKSYMSNPSSVVSNTYYIQVSRNRTALPDVDYGWKTYYADQSAQTKTWTNISNSGTFHFTLRRYTIGGASYTGNGTTSYP
jgi:hypothetical protein